MKLQEFINGISGGAFDSIFGRLYGCSEKMILRQRARYMNAAERFSKACPECGDIRVFSAPGRTEIGGNHTDHQHGCVIGAAVGLDAIAIASVNDTGIIRVKSDGFPEDSIHIDDLSPKKDEQGTSAALIRGIARRFAEKGTKLRGMYVFTLSDVQPGSGLSSSAAYEMLISTMIDKCLGSGDSGAAANAAAGQYAENVYFGKACGLMDQMISSVGGAVFIDFMTPEEPEIRTVGYDLSEAGYSLCITDTRESHSDLTADYSSVPEEMKSVAVRLGCEYLRDADEEKFYEMIPQLREQCSDRAILRAAHFFAENRRARQEFEALEAGDTETFFELVNESGRSSAELLQNLYPAGDPSRQGLTLAIMMSRRFLGGNGAVRVHGGGFAGTIQAFVPTYQAEEYSAEMDRIFGEGSCKILRIRPEGSIEITL